MLFFLTSLLPTSYLTGWWALNITLLCRLLQGLVGACGIAVLGSLLRVHSRVGEESHRSGRPGLVGKLCFVFVAGMLAAVNSFVASLVVLEFCLRAVSGWFTQESRKALQRRLVESQLSLGCVLRCTLHFLHDGAPRCCLCLLLAAALSCWLAKQAAALQQHVAVLYKLHSSQRYCGICISLMTFGRGPLLLSALWKTMAVVAFAVAVMAAVVIINQHFLSAMEALRFWTPLTICYTLLVVYMQDEEALPGSQAVLKSVATRLTVLSLLLLTVGRWADVLHVLLCFLGELSCVIPMTDLLEVTSQVNDPHLQKVLGPKGYE
ncbi:transmembrane protein 82 isoform X2 [Syngnathoides biaculeatus]|uniref:transmembrane protein 82 isoform X2 n=1 Tax=Syngnathoides biaculeatus TaxID=300417 RepID=UPI002ADE236D|nr:transmembrane protein 82 isoform X2 [Syngnathoides biaculeatus]